MANRYPATPPRALALLLLAATLTATTATVAAQPASAPAVSERFGYRLTTPEDWQARQRPGGRADLALVSPRQGRADRFIENINIIVSRTDADAGPATAHDAAEAGIANLRRSLNGFEVLSEGAFRVNGADAYRIVYRGSRANGQEVQNTTFAVVRAATLDAHEEPAATGLVLTITCSALADSHADYSGTFDEAVRSLRFDD